MTTLIARLGASLIAAAALTFAAPALAHSYKAGSLEIGHPWARETPAGASTGAAFLTVRNTGSSPDRLVAVETGAARTVELHQSVEENGIARMRQVPGVDIPAGGELALKPGGYHVMLIGLKEGLAEGMRIPATLVFEKAGRLDVELAVESMGYGGPAPAHDHGGHKH